MAQILHSALNKAEQYARALASANPQELDAAFARARLVRFAFQAFRVTDFALVTRTGHVPPVTEGFAQFWRAKMGGIPENDPETRATLLLRSAAAVDARLTQSS